MTSCRCSPGLLLALLLLGAGLQAGEPVPQGPYSGSNAANEEVLQLLLKTGHAFRQAGKMLLERTNARQIRKNHVHSLPPSVYSDTPYGYYPYSYHGVPHHPPPFYATHRPEAPSSAEDSSESCVCSLGRQLVNLANEYDEVATHHVCGCNNVAVKMREGPSPLASGKPSDVVVEVTLGKLTPPLETADVTGSTCNGENTTPAVKVYESSAKKEKIVEDGATKDSSSTVQEKTEDGSIDTHSVQVVEAIKLSPETNAYQIETFDNTVAAVEKTIEETVEIKKTVTETKTIEEQGKETVLTVKTYEEAEHPQEETNTEAEMEHETTDESKLETETRELKEEELLNDNDAQVALSETGADSEVYEAFEEGGEEKIDQVSETESTSEANTSSLENLLGIVPQGNSNSESTAPASTDELNIEDTAGNVQDNQAEDSGYVLNTEQNYENTQVENNDSMDKEISELSQYFPENESYQHLPNDNNNAEGNEYFAVDGLVDVNTPQKYVQENGEANQVVEVVPVVVPQPEETVYTLGNGDSEQPINSKSYQSPVSSQQESVPIMQKTYAPKVQYVEQQAPCEGYYGLPLKSRVNVDYSTPNHGKSNEEDISASAATFSTDNYQYRPQQLQLQPRGQSAVQTEASYVKEILAPGYVESTPNIRNSENYYQSSGANTQRLPVVYPLRTKQPEQRVLYHRTYIPTQTHNADQECHHVVKTVRPAPSSSYVSGHERHAPREQLYYVQNLQDDRHFNPGNVISSTGRTKEPKFVNVQERSYVPQPTSHVVQYVMKHSPQIEERPQPIYSSGGYYITETAKEKLQPQAAELPYQYHDHQGIQDSKRGLRQNAYVLPKYGKPLVQQERVMTSHYPYRNTEQSNFAASTNQQLMRKLVESVSTAQTQLKANENLNQHYNTHKMPLEEYRSPVIVSSKQVKPPMILRDNYQTPEYAPKVEYSPDVNYEAYQVVDVPAAELPDVPMASKTVGASFIPPQNRPATSQYYAGKKDVIQDHISQEERPQTLSADLYSQKATQASPKIIPVDVARDYEQGNLRYDAPQYPKNDGENWFPQNIGTYVPYQISDKVEVIQSRPEKSFATHASEKYVPPKDYLGVPLPEINRYQPRPLTQGTFLPDKNAQDVSLEVPQRYAASLASDAEEKMQTIAEPDMETYVRPLKKEILPVHGANRGEKGLVMNNVAEGFQDAAQKSSSSDIQREGEEALVGVVGDFTSEGGDIKKSDSKSFDESKSFNRINERQQALPQLSYMEAEQTPQMENSESEPLNFAGEPSESVIEDNPKKSSDVIVSSQKASSESPSRLEDYPLSPQYQDFAASGETETLEEPEELSYES